MAVVAEKMLIIRIYTIIDNKDIDTYALTVRERLGLNEGAVERDG